jgi:hypothetical protein
MNGFTTSYALRWSGEGVGIKRLTCWMQYHNESVLKKYGPKLKVGTVKEEAKL